VNKCPKTKARLEREIHEANYLEQFNDEQDIKDCLAEQDDIEKEIAYLRKSIDFMIFSAGISDAGEACRTVIDYGKQALKESE
jgi:hypothetical protein